MRSLQESVAIYTVEAKNGATRLRERVVVPDLEHGYQQAKYNAANQLSDWVIMNPKCLSWQCDLTRCNLP